MVINGVQPDCKALPCYKWKEWRMEFGLGVKRGKRKEKKKKEEGWGHELHLCITRGSIVIS